MSQADLLTQIVVKSSREKEEIIANIVLLNTLVANHKCLKYVLIKVGVTGQVVINIYINHANIYSVKNCAGTVPCIVVRSTEEILDYNPVPTRSSTL